MMADPGIEPQNPSRPGRTLPTNLARGANASTTPIELENTSSCTDCADAPRSSMQSADAARSVAERHVSKHRVAKIDV
jgi:hypothetical protein